MSDLLPQPSGEFILYTTDDGLTRIDVRLLGETVWLTQKQLAELFQKDVRTISEHIRNIFEEGELDENSAIRKFRITASDGKTYETTHYNLDVIISVGYRVKSHRGTQFRIWATQRLREYIIKGFAMDDERLKQNGGGDYFEELLARIRDIRASEKMFYRKILDIYATSVDYDGNAESSVAFFKIVQNKMHWAAHGHTAAEVIYERADCTKPFMGLTNFKGEQPNKSEVVVAKNYLGNEELDYLNRLVTMYLDFATLQAMNRKEMYMADWVKKLDSFLTFTERDVLTHAGKISKKQAEQKADLEYAKYKAAQINAVSPVEVHFERVIQDVKAIDQTVTQAKRTKRKE